MRTWRGCYDDGVARERPKRPTPPRRLALALAGLALALAFVTALARPAGRYFYCESMGMLPFDPCVEAPADVAPPEAASALHALHHDCCAQMTIPPLPQGAVAAAPAVPRPALATLLPAPVFASAASAPPPGAHATRLDRRRAPPRPPGASRAELMVFLT